LRNKKLKEEKIAFSEILVLFFTYLWELLYKKIKIFGRGNKEIFKSKEFLLLNYKENPMHWQIPPFSKVTWNLGVKGLTFDSLNQIFWFFVGKLAYVCGKQYQSFRGCDFFLFKFLILQAVSFNWKLKTLQQSSHLFNDI